jgi:hypothetical protein
LSSPFLLPGLLIKTPKEKNMDEVTTVTTESTEAPVSTGTEGAAASSDSALQQEMTGDFFTYDDGMGSFVHNETAMPPTDKDGNPITIKTKEDLDSFLKKSGMAKAAPQAPSAKPVVQQKTPEAISSAFEKDGKPDFKSIEDAMSRFDKVGYQGRSLIAPSKDKQPDQPTVKLAPREAIKAEIGKIETSFRKEHLEPLEALWAKCEAAGAVKGDVTYQAIQEVYSAKHGQLRDMLEEKRDELRDKFDKERDEGAQFETISKEAARNKLDCANEFFPNSEPSKREELLNNFLFGTVKDGKLVTKGYGADTVNMLFDLAHEDKTFMSQQEVVEAYDKWFAKFASVPQNIRNLTKIAYGQYQFQNRTKIRDGYRSQWDLEQQKKLNQSQAPASSKAGNAGVPDEGQAALDRWLEPPK